MAIVRFFRGKRRNDHAAPDCWPTNSEGTLWRDCTHRRGCLRVDPCDDTIEHTGTTVHQLLKGISPQLIITFLSPMPRGTSVDGGRHDAQALFIGFAGAMGIVIAFVIILCVCVCICLRRYEHDHIQRRKFVKRNIPSKRYSSGKGSVAENRTATEESKQEIRETAPDPEDGDVCSICLVSFKDRDKISWSTNEHCTHTFHMRCISSWLFKHTDCPMCREVFLCEKEEEGNSNEASIVDNQEDGSNTTGAVISPNATCVQNDEDIVVT